MTDKESPHATSVARIIESANRLGVEIDEAEALQWLAAMASWSQGDDVVFDPQTGVFGHTVTMLDFSPEELAYFRQIGQLVEFEDEPEEAPKTFDFFPDHIYTELIIGLILMVVLSALATIQPAGLGPQADPLHTPSEIKPEWFFFATFRWLKIFPLTAAVLSMGLIVFAMIVWPWIDAVLLRIFKGRDVGFWIGVAVALAIVAMTVWEALWPH